MKIFLLIVISALTLAAPASAMLDNNGGGGRPPCGWGTFGMQYGSQTCTWDPSNGFYWI